MMCWTWNGIGIWNKRKNKSERGPLIHHGWQEILRWAFLKDGLGMWIPNPTGVYRILEICSTVIIAMLTTVDVEEFV